MRKHTHEWRTKECDHRHTHICLLKSDGEETVERLGTELGLLDYSETTAFNYEVGEKRGYEGCQAHFMSPATYSPL